MDHPVQIQRRALLHRQRLRQRGRRRRGRLARDRRRPRRSPQQANRGGERRRRWRHSQGRSTAQGGNSKETIFAWIFA